MVLLSHALPSLLQSHVQQERETLQRGRLNLWRSVVHLQQWNHRELFAKCLEPQPHSGKVQNGTCKSLTSLKSQHDACKRVRLCILQKANGNSFGNNSHDPAQA
eukprot:6474899-Amphidinium_carterae.1